MNNSPKVDFKSLESQDGKQLPTNNEMPSSVNKPKSSWLDNLVKFFSFDLLVCCISCLGSCMGLVVFLSTSWRVIICNHSIFSLNILEKFNEVSAKLPAITPYCQQDYVANIIIYLLTIVVFVALPTLYRFVKGTTVKDIIELWGKARSHE